MDGGRRRKNRLWRWRNNPLRRREDIVEAWLVLAVWAVVVVGGTVVGLMTVHAADDLFARHRPERRSVRAVLLTDVPRTVAGTGSGGDRTRARVHWTDSDGSVRTGRALVDSGSRAGSGIVIWTAGRDEIVTEPLTPTEAADEAALLATGAALAFAVPVVGAGALARRRLGRRRIEKWGREWKLIGPQWGHRTG
ncbi:Rv1733c family protein [Streptomyces sp. enrichment culture]|uniref:Rv1733c family protein n=1 Tax=Streptomyces sp. enrichment culture TaxID=1795815 RepID=UPI003F560144